MRPKQRGRRSIAAELASLRIGEDDVHVEDDYGRARLRARLVVGADGAQSAVRAAVGLTADTSDYQQTAIVAIVATERPHERTAWQRFLRTGTLAFLPLADGTSSIVWSADDATARSRCLRRRPKPSRRSWIAPPDGALGATRLVERARVVPAAQARRASLRRASLRADRRCRACRASAGGAGREPRAARCRGARRAAARRRVASARIAGALRVLRRYERWRKSEVAIMGTAIDAFDRFLAHGTGPVSRLAQRGLGWVNRSQEIKRVFIAARSA